MTAERTGVGSPVVDQARPTQETLTWSEEARGKLREIVGAAPDFDALVQELHLAEVDDEVLRGFEARFQEILRLTEGAIGELNIALEAAQTAGDFADLLGGDDIGIMQENQRVLRLISEELTRNKETIGRVLSRRELERTSAEREIQEKERFVRGLNRSGFDVHELFSVMEQVAPEKATQFIIEKSSEKDPRWSREVDEINKQYALALEQIQQERKSLSKKLVRSDQLKSWIAGLGLTDNLEENPNEDPKPLVVQLRAKGKYEEALQKVRVRNAEELATFEAADEPRLKALEVEAAEKRDAEFKKVLFGEPHSRQGQYYKMKVEDVTPLLEDGSISRESVAQKIAEQILKRFGRYGDNAPAVTPREVAFLPKNILDRLVAGMNYEAVANAIAVKDDKEKPAIFWSESFGDRLAQMRARYKELSTKQAFEETDPPPVWAGRETSDSERKRNLLDDPKSLSGKLFAEYQKADTAYRDARLSEVGHSRRNSEREAAIERNQVFESEIGGIFEKYRIRNTLAGFSGDINRQNSERGFSSVGDTLFLNGNYLFLNDANRERGERVSSLYGQRSIQDQRNRKEFTPEQEDAYQRSEFLEIQGQIKEFARSMGVRDPLAEESQKSKQENAARTLLAEKSRQIETDFASLDAELAPLKADTVRIAQEVAALQEKMRGMYNNMSLPELTALKDENARVVAAVKECNTRATALREKTQAWGFRGYTGDALQDGARDLAASVRGDLLAEEKSIWDNTIARTLEYGNAQQFLGQNFGANIESQLRQATEQVQKQEAALELQLRQQAEALAKETRDRERSIQRYVSEAEDAYRLKNSDAVETARAIGANQKAIAEAQTFIGTIDRVLENNKSVTFGTLFGRKKTISYCDEQGQIFEAKEVTEDEYNKEYKKRMETLRVEQENRIKEAKTKITNFRREFEGINVEEPYKQAVYNLRLLRTPDATIPELLRKAEIAMLGFSNKRDEILK